MRILKEDCFDIYQVYGKIQLSGYHAFFFPLLTTNLYVLEIFMLRSLQAFKFFETLQIHFGVNLSIFSVLFFSFRNWGILEHLNGIILGRQESSSTHSRRINYSSIQNKLKTNSEHAETSSCSWSLGQIIFSVTFRVHMS